MRCFEDARAVFVHSKLRDSDKLNDVINGRIPIIFDDKTFARLGINDNSYCLGVFVKREQALTATRPHVVLVSPSDMGNLGTIIRTVVGLGYHDIAIIKPAADVFHPKTVRATMGALFHLNVCQYDSFDGYQAAYPSHELFPFMLDAAVTLDTSNTPECRLFSLIFGNEASGLPPVFQHIGKPVKLAQSAAVDSLNLSIATGIGAYLFAAKNRLL